MVGFQARVYNFDSGETYSSIDVYLHHLLMLHLFSGQDDFIRANECDDDDAIWFTASGAEFTHVVLPEPYVYLMDSEAIIAGAWELKNNLSDVINVGLEFVLDYVVVSQPSQVIPVVPLFLDVTECDEGAYSLDGQGGVDIRRKTYRTFWSGELVWCGGHMHTGGISVSLLDTSPESLVDTENLIFESIATHHVSGEVIDEMTTGEPMWDVEMNSELTVLAKYDNSVARRHVMGIMFAYAHIEEVDRQSLHPISAQGADVGDHWIYAVLATILFALLTTVSAILYFVWPHLRSLKVDYLD
eukprot:CAMPEP_0201547678 /NCGR_PEP_ID=MMETSP0173_2-20130828/4169_1 /ASSEMBLY_ACC=CAM_ASM_000268 /TAXON_ID=218659 /ORGANISM="Vexillifera sp., Strain DIVA3 564/2" /LENGTH=299 /DNA_ID=CAMNT_0047956807 /DNA_START=204 /DNA_END=1103 /DNA_ORIENTATION=-